MKLIDNYYKKKWAKKYDELTVSQLEQEENQLRSQFNIACDNNARMAKIHKLEKELNYVINRKNFCAKYPELVHLRKVEGTGPKSQKGRTR